MKVWDAIEQRKSYREFKTTPIPRKMIEKILTAGCMAPSSANMQPWEFVVLAGPKRDEISRIMMQSFKERKKNYDILGKDQFFPQHLLDRRKKFFTDIFHQLSCHNESPMKYVMQGSLRFYDAPVIIFTFIDTRIAKRFLFDIGASVQNIVLAAQSEGLGTHLIGLVLKYQETVKKFLGLCEHKEMVIGISLGYPDMENPINAFTPGREKIDRFVTWVGI
jgi:nitroreductase